MANDGLASAAWGGPLGCVVLKPDHKVTEDALKEFLRDKVKASWWIPDHSCS